MSMRFHKWEFRRVILREGVLTRAVAKQKWELTHIDNIDKNANNQKNFMQSNLLKAN